MRTGSYFSHDLYTPPTYCATKFDYMHNSTSLWTWRNLQDTNQAELSDQDLDLDAIEADPTKVLNYPLQDEHSFKCFVYDLSPEESAQTNSHTSDAVRAL